MAENTILKVFLRDGQTTEARRFTVDALVVTNYLYMREKLQAMFPVLRNAEYKITWKDSDGDEITIACDEDFITAFTEMSDNVKVLYVTVKEHNSEPIFVDDTEEPSPRIVCDVCEQMITGLRYKCLQCPDYDLCATCEHKGHHLEHLMMRVPNAGTFMPKCSRKLMHYVARNLKKSAAGASKAHRSGRHYGRFHCNTNATDEGKAQEEPTTRSESQSNTQSSNPGPSASSSQAKGCPFTENLNNVHALGSMVKQQFGPLLDAFSNVALGENPNKNSTNNQEGGGDTISDLILGAIERFYSEIAVPQETPKPNEGPKQNEGPKKEETFTKEVPAQSVPMDVETPVRDNSQEKQPQNGNAAKPNDPGWIFVANNPQAQQQPQQSPQPNQTASGTNQENQASAPTLIYHPNPTIAAGLAQLYEMGFSNSTGILTTLLENYQGDVSKVVRRLIELRN